MRRAVGRDATMMIAVAAMACPLLLAGAGQATAGTRMPAGARAADLAGTWNSAEEVPGIATLNTGGNAQINSVSCGSAGNCSAGGFFKDGSGNYQAFVASRVNGTWNTAIEVPGIASLNTGGNAQISSVSCASAGNCSAGGSYKDGPGKDGTENYQAFVVNEVNGIWDTAMQVPGTANLNTGGTAAIYSVSSPRWATAAPAASTKTIPGARRS